MRVCTSAASQCVPGMQSMRRIRGSYHRARSGLAIGLFFLLLLLSLLEDITFDFTVHSLRIEFISAP